MAENAMVLSNTNRGINYFDPEALTNAQRACKMITNSELVPDTFKVSKVGVEKATANAIIALDLASRIGCSALMVMQNLYVVYGRPSFSSAFLVATINTCGRYETLKYAMGIEKNPDGTDQYLTIDGKQIPNMWCYAYTWEKNQQFMSEEDKRVQCLKSTKINLKMAIDEGWYTKSGSKWKTMPSQMLKYRASSFWCRAFAPELSMGMHTTEELNDGIVEDVEFTELNSNSKPNFDEAVKEEQAKEQSEIENKAEEIRKKNEAKMAAVKAAEALKAKKEEVIERASSEFETAQDKQ